MVIRRRRAVNDKGLSNDIGATKRDLTLSFFALGALLIGSAGEAPQSMPLAILIAFLSFNAVLAARRIRLIRKREWAGVDENLATLIKLVPPPDGDWKERRHRA
jgi:hypothetical protein